MLGCISCDITAISHMKFFISFCSYLLIVFTATSILELLPLPLPVCRYALYTQPNCPAEWFSTFQ